MNMYLDDFKTNKEVNLEDSTKATKEYDKLIDPGINADNKKVDGSNTENEVVDPNNGPINDAHGVDPKDDNVDPKEGVDPSSAHNKDSYGSLLFFSF